MTTDSPRAALDRLQARRLRDAAHEWGCVAAGPTDLVHCRRCDCVDVREEMTLGLCWICTARWLETARAPF